MRNSIKVRIVEVQLGIGLNMFFPEFKNLVFVDATDYNKVMPINASFADKYKAISKSAKNKKSKL